MSTHRAPRGRVGPALLAAVLVGVVLLWLTRPVGDDPAVVNAAVAGEGGSPPSPSAAAPVVQAAPTPTTPEATETPGPPTRLAIPALAATLPVTPVGVSEQGAMEIPDDPRTAGWYRYGPGPGEAGATVLTAHVDSRERGPGPLAGLRTLDSGDELTVTADGQPHRYRVLEVYTAGKDELDLDAVFRRDGREALHVVTCGGAFDAATGHYEDNVVAVAEPISE
ncbi:hypothetical protein GCM10022199_00980 [Marihabitans asiaticum]|uniref:Sortase (Surface protein transpeptidase) n=1 Tax=Marihabitans asiaticum TaxID=415218 RepID=A0A560WFZ4_9MICO|nr:class F sortase [Marihabitans asiaticum]TWD16623.1 sortase (surface protein transpeptidase) [Marihabitans asiaticum]